MRLPDVNLDTIKENPAQAVYTCIRTECQRCHLGVRGRDKRGDMRGIDMAPAAPHTGVRQARSFASCHTNSKALGYGTHDGRYMTGSPNGITVDVATAQGEMVSKHARVQIPPIPELPMDLNQVVTRLFRQNSNISSISLVDCLDSVS